MALAYVDWTAQEVGIAAALSGDPALIKAYRSGDVYLDFAVRSGLAPAGATAASHAAVRDRCKRCVLSLGYGIGANALAARIARPPVEARELMRLHKQAYPQFWRWVDENVAGAVLHRGIWTCFGWFQHIDDDFNPRSLMNFSAQAHGAEILRLAACLATERGLTIAALIHDAILLEAPTDELEGAVAGLKDCMQEAGRVVLGGFELACKATTITYPDRYMDGAGAEMWATVMRLLGEAESVNLDIFGQSG
jgi:DNA polymerase I-like protein with 3'-5' exonuclease and polymerase domains